MWQFLSSFNPPLLMVHPCLGLRERVAKTKISVDSIDHSPPQGSQARPPYCRVVGGLVRPQSHPLSPHTQSNSLVLLLTAKNYLNLDEAPSSLKDRFMDTFVGCC